MKSSVEQQSKVKEKINKINEAMTVIPPQGMSWVDFKKAAPHLENIAEVKKVFMTKANKPTMPEDLMPAVQEYQKQIKKKEFTVTYSKWSGAQTHNDNSDLVFQINTSESLAEEVNADPKLSAMYTYVMQSYNASSHPTTPHSISWSRVDTSNGAKGWIIEEFQSDVMNKMRPQINQAIKDSNSGVVKLGDLQMPKDEAKQLLKKLTDMFQESHNAALNAIEEAAKKHGVKNLYMHGSAPRASMSGSGYLNGARTSYSKDFISHGITRQYDDFPKANGFEGCEYTDYPSFDRSMATSVKHSFGNIRCWVKKLT
jgi:hypothetical protein